MSCELHKYLVGDMCLPPVASATANNTSTVVDSAGYDGVMFVANIGTVASASVTLAITGAPSTSAAFQALSGATVTSTTGDDDGPLVVNVHKPLQAFRFMKATLSHAAAAELGGIMAYKYGPHKIPTTWPTSAAVNGGVSVVSPGT